MLIRAGFDIAYECPVPSPMILMLSVHPTKQLDLKSPQRLTIAPDIPVVDYRDTFGNVCHRIVAPAGNLNLTADFLIEVSEEPDEADPTAEQHAVERLPNETLIYLMGSRYCETDRLVDSAWSLFGNTPEGWPRVQAIVDFVHHKISFNYADARPTRTAWEAFQEGRGVCRDFAHLAVALCRCMNIPARYCTGYMGDIRVPRSDSPMDFSAWFDVFLGGKWWTFDARHNRPRVGRILMARGRDATDVALTTTFGSAWLSRFVVVTDEVEG